MIMTESKSNLFVVGTHKLVSLPCCKRMSSSGSYIKRYNSSQVHPKPGIIQPDKDVSFLTCTKAFVAVCEITCPKTFDINKVSFVSLSSSVTKLVFATSLFVFILFLDDGPSSSDDQLTFSSLLCCVFLPPPFPLPSSVSSSSFVSSSSSTSDSCTSFVSSSSVVLCSRKATGIFWLTNKSA